MKEKIILKELKNRGWNMQFDAREKHLIKEVAEITEAIPVEGVKPQTAGLNNKAIEIINKYGVGCPDCDDEGFYWKNHHNGLPEAVQCQFCYVEPKSKYNLRQDLTELINGLSL